MEEVRDAVEKHGGYPLQLEAVPYYGVCSKCSLYPLRGSWDPKPPIRHAGFRGK